MIESPVRMMLHLTILVVVNHHIPRRLPELPVSPPIFPDIHHRHKRGPNTSPTRSRKQRPEPLLVARSIRRRKEVPRRDAHRAPKRLKQPCGDPLLDIAAAITRNIAHTQRDTRQDSRQDQKRRAIPRTRSRMWQHSQQQIPNSRNNRTSHQQPRTRFNPITRPSDHKDHDKRNTIRRRRH